MSYSPFGRRQVTAVIDQGFNPFNNTGNPTATFTPNDLKLPQGQFEISKMAIQGASPGATIAVYIDTFKNDGCIADQAGNAHWYKASDGEFIVTNQSVIYFYFMHGGFIALTGLPVVTMWLCYDPMLAANRGIWSQEGLTH